HIHLLRLANRESFIPPERTLGKRSTRSPRFRAYGGTRSSIIRRGSWYSTRLEGDCAMVRTALVLLALLLRVSVIVADEPAELRKAVTFYASFDEEVHGDAGGGALEPGTRFNHATEQGKFVFEKGIDA